MKKFANHSRIQNALRNIANFANMLDVASRSSILHAAYNNVPVCLFVFHTDENIATNL